MGNSVISFPGLGIDRIELNPEVFPNSNVSIAWYGLIITIGMILCVGYVIYRAGKIGISSEIIIDYAIFVIPLGIIGARLYYVLMELDNFDSLMEVIDIRSGGLAIYGGIIAGALTVLVVSRFKKISFLAFGDCVVPGLILAQSIGRWGNFVNVEAFGSVTALPWRMCGEDIADYLDSKNLVSAEEYADIINGTLGVHPTFFYESLWNLIGFIIINLVYKKKKYDGQIVLLVFGWYGLGRMLIEGLRTDSLYLFGTGIRVSQLLAALIFITCLSLLIYFSIKKPEKELYVYKCDKKEEK